jgi:hypothetical protein
MGKALNSSVEQAQQRRADFRTANIDWRKRMSDHVAYALLVYTALQIGVTMSLVDHGQGSVLPYFALVLLVVAVIPCCRLFEQRWTELSDAQAHDLSLKGKFARDRLALWLCALGLPFVLAAFFRGVALLLG